jgi:hypothetical protein
MRPRPPASTAQQRVPRQDDGCGGEQRRQHRRVPPDVGEESKRGQSDRQQGRQARDEPGVQARPGLGGRRSRRPANIAAGRRRLDQHVMKGSARLRLNSIMPGAALITLMHALALELAYCSGSDRPGTARR